MSSRERTIHPSAQILYEALGAGHLTRADVMRVLGLASRQNVTNWLSHGIPARHIPDVAKLCGMSTDEYRARSGIGGAAGALPFPPIHREHEQLVANFDALPRGLQVYFLRKIKEARKFAAGLPAFLLEDVPDDDARLRAWERGFFEAMERQAAGVEPPEAVEE